MQHWETSALPAAPRGDKALGQAASQPLDDGGTLPTPRGSGRHLEPLHKVRLASKPCEPPPNSTPPPTYPPTHRPRVQGDGRYLISNGKDQTIKLWDLRRMATPAEAQRWRQDRVPHFSWDYR